MLDLTYVDGLVFAIALLIEAALELCPLDGSHVK